MALAPWSDLLELCCLGSGLGPRAEPQRNLRHLAANAASSPAPLARPEEQGEDACRAEGLQECWMLTHLGRCVERWGNSLLPKRSPRTALQSSWTPPQRPSTTPKPTFGREQFAMRGSACRSLPLRTWTPSAPSSGHSLGATTPWWRSR